MGQWTVKIHLDVSFGCEKHCIGLEPQSRKLCLPQHGRKTYLDVPERKCISTPNKVTVMLYTGRPDERRISGRGRGVARATTFLPPTALPHIYLPTAAPLPFYPHDS